LDLGLPREIKRRELAFMSSQIISLHPMSLDISLRMCPNPFDSFLKYFHNKITTSELNNYIMGCGGFSSAVAGKK